MANGGWEVDFDGINDFHNRRSEEWFAFVVGVS